MGLPNGAIFALLVVSGLSRNAPDTAQCPSDAGALRSARAVTVHPEDDPVFQVEFLLHEFCGTPILAVRGKEISWRIVVDRERAESPDPKTVRLTLVDPVDRGPLVDLPSRTGIRWVLTTSLVTEFPRDARATFDEVFERLWDGRIAVRMTLPGESGSTPVPVESVYRSDWDVNHEEEPPEIPLHCLPGTAATRSLSGRAVVAAGDSLGYLYLHLMEFDRPIRSSPTQAMKWDLRLDPAVLETGARARLLPAGAPIDQREGVDLEPWPRRFREHFPSKYGEEGGFYRGSLPFRDLYRRARAGEMELLLELPGRDAIRVPVTVTQELGWRINCT